MKRLSPLFRHRGFPLLFALCLSGSAVRAGSVEQVPPTAADLARELGIAMEKFSVKFDEPVYCTVKLRWKQPDGARASTLQQGSLSAEKEHTIVFSRRDLGQLQARTGGTAVKAAKGLMDFNIAFSGLEMVYRDYNPLRSLKTGENFRQWSRRQSFEELPLDSEIPLVILAGPWRDDAGAEDLLSTYTKAPGFISLSVKFTRKPLPVPAGQLPGRLTEEKAAAPAPSEPQPPAAPPVPAR